MSDQKSYQRPDLGSLIWSLIWSICDRPFQIFKHVFFCLPLTKTRTPWLWQDNFNLLAKGWVQHSMFNIVMFRHFRTLPMHIPCNYIVCKYIDLNLGEAPHVIFPLPPLPSLVVAWVPCNVIFCNIDSATYAVSNPPTLSSGLCWPPSQQCHCLQYFCSVIVYNVIAVLLFTM